MYPSKFFFLSSKIGKCKEAKVNFIKRYQSVIKYLKEIQLEFQCNFIYARAQNDKKINKSQLSMRVDLL